MKTSEQRINNIIGQLEGIKKVLAGDKKRDCIALIVQLKAIKSAMASLMEKIIADEFSHCLLEDKKNSQEKMAKIFRELVNK